MLCHSNHFQRATDIIIWPFIRCKQIAPDIGSIFCRTYNGKLAFLNNMVGVFEYESDVDGNSRGKIWNGSNKYV